MRLLNANKCSKKIVMRLINEIICCSHKHEKLKETKTKADHLLFVSRFERYFITRIMLSDRC